MVVEGLQRIGRCIRCWDTCRGFMEINEDLVFCQSLQWAMVLVKLTLERWQQKGAEDGAHGSGFFMLWNSIILGNPKLWNGWF